MPPFPSPTGLPAVSVPPPPSPPPPPPAPAQPAAPQPPAVIGSTLNAALVLAAVGILSAALLTGLAMVIGAVVYFGGFWRPAPPGPTTADFAKIGEEYAKRLPSSYGAAWKGYAADLRNGKTVADATKAMNEAWKDNREAIYKALVLPEMAKIVPDGEAEDKVTPAQRSALAAAAEGMAKGLGVPP